LPLSRNHLDLLAADALHLASGILIASRDGLAAFAVELDRHVALQKLTRACAWAGLKTASQRRRGRGNGWPGLALPSWSFIIFSSSACSMERSAATFVPSRLIFTELSILDRTSNTMSTSTSGA